MDKIDQLIACLGEHMPDVPFDRDALNVDRPAERWGAAELRRQVAGQWADGHLIDQALEVDLYLCVDDRESAWLADVQDALNEFSDTEDIGYGFAERVYLPAIDRALWRWGISFFGGLEVTEPEAETDETGGSGTENTGTENTGTESTGTDSAGTETTGTETTGTETTGSETTGTETTETEPTEPAGEE